MTNKVVNENKRMCLLSAQNVHQKSGFGPLIGLLLVTVLYKCFYQHVNTPDLLVMLSPIHCKFGFIN